MALNFANNNSLSSITSLPSGISGGGLNLISTQTASDSSSLSFTNGIGSTYKEYVFKFINIHPANNSVDFQFNFSSDSGSNYNVVKTTSVFVAYNRETGSDFGLSYYDAYHLAQSTNYQTLNHNIGSDNDQAMTGELRIFDPNSSVFQKHFTARTLSHQASDYALDQYVGGYGNTTSSINAVDFKFASGNIQTGVIKLYGIS